MQMICTQCGDKKDETEFHLREGGRRRKQCARCHAANVRARYHKDPEPHKAYIKGWKDRNRDRMRATNAASHKRRRKVLSMFLRKAATSKRVQCKRMGWPCDVTAEVLQALFAAQNGKCALTGRPLEWGDDGWSRDALSIDRIEGPKGYIAGNMRLVTFQANLARGRFTDDELLDFCRDATQHMRSPPSDGGPIFHHPC